MDVEWLPSGSMKVNELVLTISMLAFNTLRYIGQSALALPPPASDYPNNDAAQATAEGCRRSHPR
jgi:hypothetical protein